VTDKPKKVPREEAVVYDFNPARPALVAAGVAEDEVDHVIDQANEAAIVLVSAMDRYVSDRNDFGACVHPEALCLAVALVGEKFLSDNLDFRSKISTLVVDAMKALFDNAELRGVMVGGMAAAFASKLSGGR
jgi:hypothetical protein